MGPKLVIMHVGMGKGAYVYYNIKKKSTNLSDDMQETWKRKQLSPNTLRWKSEMLK